MESMLQDPPIQKSCLRLLVNTFHIYLELVLYRLSLFIFQLQKRENEIKITYDKITNVTSPCLYEGLRDQSKKFVFFKCVL